MTRADTLLVTKGLASSRTAAQRLIAEGRALVDGIAVVKPAQDIAESAALAVTPDAADRYVSRGGLKLAGALAHCGIDVRDMLCLDVGQSTGGFTDCLLQAGAAEVVGVDVGHDQLREQLRADERVTCIEGVNARALEKSALVTRQDARQNEQAFDLIVADLSFISLTLVLPQLPALLADDGTLLLLVKPQFELSPGQIGKGGIVRDAAFYPQVEARLRDAAASLGLQVLDWFESPITGGDGNREFFIRINK